MKKSKLKNSRISSLAFLLTLCVLLPACRESIDTPTNTGQIFQFSPAGEINKKLGMGINLNSAFEGDRYDKYDVSSLTLKHCIDEIKKQGFNHIRIPIRWDRTDRSMYGAPYLISEDFLLKEIKTVVDYALEKDLYVIINMHNYTSLYENPEKENARFLAQWTQIASTFNNYPEKLLFEILNEPSNRLTPALWNQYYKEALAVIRNTPAASNNAKRTVLIGTPNYGGPESLSQLQLPSGDNHIILTVHYYVPFRFTHQDSWVEESAAWKGITWDDTEGEREMLKQSFQLVKKISAETGIPVHIGEFGSYENADADSRARYAAFSSKWFREEGFSCTYWGFTGNFGIYDAETKTYKQSLLDALKTGSMPAPHIPANSRTIYTSNITSADNDGWLPDNYEKDIAAMTTKYGNNTIEMDITKPGTNQWTLLVEKERVKIQRGRKYCVTFTASSTSPNQSVQWTFVEKPETNNKPAITGEDYIFYLGTTPQKYSIVLTALSTQNNGKMIFFVGGHTSASLVKISDIQVTEFYDEILMPEIEQPAEPIIIYSGENISPANPDGWKVFIWDSNTEATAVFGNNSITVNITKPGSGTWSTGLEGGGGKITAGRKYELSITASTSLPSQELQFTFLEKSGSPNITSPDFIFKATPTPERFTFSFTAKTSQNWTANWLFFGGSGEPSTVTFSDIVLADITDI